MDGIRKFVAPAIYVQGPNAIQGLPNLVADLGSRPLVVTDAGVEALLGERLKELLGASVPVLTLRSEITPAAIAGLVAAARPYGADVVCAVGGGKALDAGKGVARDTAARFISVPTIASNDAPTSRAIALYGDEDHRFMVETLGRSPNAVVADTQILASAPPHFLRWGIGDALAKAGEARGCAASPAGRTPLGALPTQAGLALALSCHETLRSQAAMALRSAGSGAPDPAFEAVVEAVILMSGLGFENGGLGLAHAMTRGLMSADRTCAHAHGEQVAYGSLVQLALDASDEQLRAERDFVRSIGLPARLSDFRQGAPSESEVSFLACQATTAKQHVLNHTHPLSTPQIEAAIRRVEALP